MAEPYIQVTVDQPAGGGTNFPFVSPSDNLGKLIGDLELIYKDDDRVFEGPFSLDWLFGFGTVPASAPGFAPSPIHVYEVLIRDKNDAVVFDSTVGVYTLIPWNSNLQILEWRTTTAVLRLVQYLQWDEGSTASTFPQNIAPTDGTLDARTHVRKGQAITGIKVGSQTLVGKVRLEAGYNISMVDETLSGTKDGGRRGRQVTLNAIPGAGLGRFPGCTDEFPPIYRINGQGPDAKGNFILDAEDCYFLYSVSGSELLYNDGKSGYIAIHNGCSPCCECEDYVNTYLGLKNVWNRAKIVDTGAHDAAVLYNENVDRWNAQRDCRLARPLNLLVQPFCPCMFAVSGAICNNTDECLTDVVLKFTFDSLPSERAPHVAAGQTVRNGNELYTLGGTWPVYTAFFENIDPGGKGSVRFRLDVGGCQLGDVVRATLTAYSLTMTLDPAPIPVIEIAPALPVDPETGECG